MQQSKKVEGEDDNEPAQGKEDETEVVTGSEDVNLQYGDIVYFKFYKDLSKGIISGDGIAGNKIECISMGKIIESGSEDQLKFD